jgi:hypothetical protein
MTAQLKRREFISMLGGARGLRARGRCRHSHVEPDRAHDGFRIIARKNGAGVRLYSHLTR